MRSRYGGVLLGLDVRDRTHQLGLSGKYGVVVSGEVEKLNPGDCFIDVGANCGVFSLLAAERVGPDGLVVSFEPCFATFAKLVRNIGLNHLDNVLPFNMAIAALSGPDLLDSRSEGHSGRYAIAPEPIETGERVMSLSIRDFPGLMKLIGDRPIIVKIDVEGFEHAVLQGLERVLVLPQTRSIVVEIDQRNLNRYGSDPQAIYALLEGHGFSRSDATDSTMHFDAVFHRKEPVAARSEHIARAVHPRHAPRNRAALPTRKANWHRLPQIAAAMMLLAGGWLIGNASFPSGMEQAEENFVEEALQSHNIAQVQTKLRRSPPAVVNPVEVGSLTRIALPILPKGWYVINIQVFPSDSGPSLQMNITNGKSTPISLFAVRDDKVAPSRPDVTTRDGNAIAYWQEGDLAYALISKKSPEELDRLAEDIADNITS
ncbi:FkbM family methyltransferase [Rhizorhapis sp. SPR117]|uniref:FkbM family methyltransferase n=1 Tax=Rhizorhapis sp. SPR117 TaxID=2912611 RepID=UPI001F02123B|nr:FkbM family methyltransferase [Rhizorhapis sp. SPR117]